MATVSASKLPRVAVVAVVTLVVIAAWLAAIARQQRRLTAAVQALPADVQEATYRRMYDELATTCAAHPEFADHCGDVARFILRFPQCGADCATMAHRYFPTVTR